MVEIPDFSEKIREIFPAEVIKIMLHVYNEIRVDFLQKLFSKCRFPGSCAAANTYDHKKLS
jgi:hypothetical protein